METNNCYTPLCELFAATAQKEKKNIIAPLKLAKGGLRFVTFAKTKTEMAAAETIHRLAPNLVYGEKAYIAVKGGIRALFSFGSLSSKESSEVFRDGVTLSSGFTLKSAPAYRVNYSRLWVSALRTLKQNGCEISFAEKSTPGIGFKPIAIMEGLLRHSPVKKTLLIPCDDFEILLLNRGDTFYIIGWNICDQEKIVALVNSVLTNASVYLKNFKSITTLNINESERLFESWLQGVDADKVILDGCNFDFSPSAPDVIGFADMKFDEVKRMDINVNSFKNAVFDFGTNIDTIIEQTYDLYSEYHKGQAAFDAAVDKWVGEELN